MKRFLLIVLSYVMVLLFFLFVINAVYVRMSPLTDDDTEKFSNIPKNIQVCNVGSSHGLYGFNYENHTELESFNFGLSSQMLNYDYRLLRYYQKNLAQGCTVFIPVSYFSFLGKGETAEENFESKNKRYYKILPPRLIKNFDWTNYLHIKFPVLNAGGVNILWTLAGKELGLRETKTTSVWDQTSDEIDLIADVNAAYERHLVTNKIDEQGQYILCQEELDAVYDIISLCKKNGWRPVLVTMPFLKEYTDLAYEGSSEYLDIFYGLIDRIVEDTQVEYYDYSLDERFYLRHDLFMNGDHLNREGAKMFTDLIFQEVLYDTTS